MAFDKDVFRLYVLEPSGEIRAEAGFGMDEWIDAEIAYVAAAAEHPACAVVLYDMRTATVARERPAERQMMPA